MSGWKRMDGQRMRGGKTTDYHVVAVLISFLDLRLEPNLWSIIQPACNYERCCSISARKSKIQDVGKAPPFFFFCLFARGIHTVSQRPAWGDSQVWILQWASVMTAEVQNVAAELIRSPTGARGWGSRGSAAAGGPWRHWERAASEGQLDAASGDNREGMKPPESSSYLPDATKETTVGKGDEARSGPGGMARRRRWEEAFRFGLKLKNWHLCAKKMRWIKVFFLLELHFMR